jgi:TonB-dependent SusC/RagA subfamily outer membrane receptor
MSQPRQFLSWRSLLLVFACIVQHCILTAQTKTVYGTVKNEKGDPLAGASISIENSQQAVFASETGTFSITVPDTEAKLEVSMVGYETAVISAAGTQLNVVLKDANKDMEEVVVVGYGKQKKASLTGSVSQISGAQLKQAPAMNVSNLLAGRLPGLITLQNSGRPGNDDAALRVRGLGTMGDNQPTVIVDGVQRDFYNLDPNEIETVTILKDAASAAVYGFQGANGVILVTTKKR